MSSSPASARRAASTTGSSPRIRPPGTIGASSFRTRMRRARRSHRRKATSRRSRPRTAGLPRSTCRRCADRCPASPQRPLRPLLRSGLLRLRRLRRRGLWLAALGRLVRRRCIQHALLARRQRLVFGPVLLELLTLLGRQLAHALVALARDAALLGRQLGPALHALPHALLLLGLHARVAIGDANPVRLARTVELVPVGFQRVEDLLLARGELGPGGLWFLRRRRAGCEDRRREDERCQRARQRAARFFSHASNPRSR